jgi:putative colanic acid biosysnthesis UDP-glucose lipid carrier transferase
MSGEYVRFYRRMFESGEIVLFTLLMFLPFFLLKNEETHMNKEIFFFLFTSLGWWILSKHFYNSFLHRGSSAAEVFLTSFREIAMLFLPLATLTFLLHFSSEEVLLCTFTVICIFTLAILYRQSLFSYLQYKRTNSWNQHNFIILGTNKVSVDLMEYLQNDTFFKNRFLGFFDDNPYPGCFNVVGSLQEIEHFLERNKVNYIFSTLEKSQNEKVKEIIKLSDNYMIRFQMIPPSKKLAINRNLNFIGPFPVLPLRKEPLVKPKNNFVKRIFDVLFSSLAILAIFPWLYPLVALAIKLDSKGPVLFRQKRTGKDNETFLCLKFRTMKKNKECDLLQASSNDKRITRLGHFLRGSHIDELPQLFNVLKGDMSIVGPRPHMLKHTEEYSSLIDGYLARHYVKPGITGLAQAYGFCGETKELELMKKRVQYDMWYIENWTLLLDLRIIALTAFNIISNRKNAITRALPQADKEDVGEQTRRLVVGY